jgi:hypothetical protein
MKRIVPPDAFLKRMYRSGMSCSEMAKYLNIKLNTAMNAIQRMHDLKKRSYSESAKLSYKHGRKATSFWTGKKQPPEMIEKRIAPIRGKNNYMWKDGKSRRTYRKLIIKDKCFLCGIKHSLSIHHIDFNHYNDDPKNLRVLCVHCHHSIHSKRYWDQYYKGIVKRPCKYKKRRKESLRMNSKLEVK